MLAKSIFTCLITWTFVATVGADTTLRMKFEEGKTTKQKMTMKQSMGLPVPGQANAKMEIEQVMHQELKCLKISGGIAELEQKMTRAQATMHLPAPLNRTVYYDTDEKTTNNPLAGQLDKVLRPMIGVPCAMKSDLLGKITDVKVNEDALKGLKNSPASALGGDLTSPEGIQSMTQQAAIQFPEKAIAVGYQWDTEVTMNSPIGKMLLTRHHTYKGLDSETGFEKIDITVDKKLEPSDTPNPALQGAKVTMKSAEGTGSFLFDAKRGRIAKSQLTDKTEMEIAAGNQTFLQKVDVEVILEDVTQE